MAKQPRGLEAAIKYVVVAKVVDTETGRVVAEKRFKGRSFLLNFAKLCRLLFMRGDESETESVLDLDGNSRTMASATTAYAFPHYSPAADRKIRVRLGTSTTPFSRDQRNVLTFLAESTYSSYTRTDTGTSLRVDVTFSWLNNTGATKEVSEAALIVRCIDTTNIMHAVAYTRDLISPAISVGAGQTLSIAYIITLPW